MMFEFRLTYWVQFGGRGGQSSMLEHMPIRMCEV